MDRGTWSAIVREVSKSQPQLSYWAQSIHHENRLKRREICCNAVFFKLGFPGPWALRMHSWVSENSQQDFPDMFLLWCIKPTTPPNQQIDNLDYLYDTLLGRNMADISVHFSAWVYCGVERITVQFSLSVVSYSLWIERITSRWNLKVKCSHQGRAKRRHAELKWRQFSWSWSQMTLWLRNI